MQRKVAFLLSFLLLGAAVARAQRVDNSFYPAPDFVEPIGWSVGGYFGMSDLWGDVGTKSFVDHYNNSKYWNKLHAMGGLYARYSFSPALGARAMFSYGALGARDNWNYNKALKATSIEDDAFQRYLRNQDVRTTIWEGLLMAEVTPFRINKYSKAARRRWQPYGLIGVGAFYYRAFGEYTARNGTGGGRLIDLNTVRLEGQGFVDAEGKPLENATKKDNNFQFCVPAGLGVRWDIGHHLGLGVEYLFRYCFTDQLDGVSGKYIDPTSFDLNLTPQNAAIAKDMYDKSWQVFPNSVIGTNNVRGNPDKKDSYSTISISIFYRLTGNQKSWWF